MGIGIVRVWVSEEQVVEHVWVVNATRKHCSAGEAPRYEAPVQTQRKQAACHAVRPVATHSHEKCDVCATVRPEILQAGVIFVLFSFTCGFHPF